jgi:uncharacterized protein
MNMKTPLFLLLVSIALPATRGLAQFNPQPPQINVSGSAEVKVAPDEIRISVGVETRHENLDEATRQHDERMKTALGFLKTSGVPDKNVQTDFINVQPEYDSNVSRVKPVVYIVRKSIGIKLTTVTNLEPVLTGLLKHGANYIHDIDFRTTQLRKHRDQARALAIRAAREKADAFARELGVTCGKPININASEWGGWWSSSGSNWGWGGRNYSAQSQNTVQNMGGSSDSAGETLSIGQISVSATVNVSFLIE